MTAPLPPPFSHTGPVQVEQEFQSLLEFISSHGVRRYCEVGARQGDSFYRVVRELLRPSFGLAIDLPGVKSSGVALRACVSDLSRRGHDVQLILGDSRRATTLEKVVPHAPFDLVFIAADPRYAAVAEDFANFGPLTKFVAFRDISNRFNGIEVPRLWDEIKTQFQHWEFIAPDSKQGIGVLSTGLHGL